MLFHEFLYSLPTLTFWTKILHPWSNIMYLFVLVFYLYREAERICKWIIIACILGISVKSKVWGGCKIQTRITILALFFVSMWYTTHPHINASYTVLSPGALFTDYLGNSTRRIKIYNDHSHFYKLLVLLD